MPEAQAAADCSYLQNACVSLQNGLLASIVMQYPIFIWRARAVVAGNQVFGNSDLRLGTASEARWSGDDSSRRCDLSREENGI